MTKKERLKKWFKENWVWLLLFILLVVSQLTMPYINKKLHDMESSLDKNNTVTETVKYNKKMLSKKVPINDNVLEGTWTFNDILIVPSKPLDIYLFFISNNTTFDNFYINSWGLKYFNDSRGTNAYDTDINEWENPSFKNITFYNDVNNPTFFNWLKSNAKKISELDIVNNAYNDAYNKGFEAGKTEAGLLTQLQVQAGLFYEALYFGRESEVYPNIPISEPTPITINFTSSYGVDLFKIVNDIASELEVSPTGMFEVYLGLKNDIILDNVLFNISHGTAVNNINFEYWTNDYQNIIYSLNTNDLYNGEFYVSTPSAINTIHLSINNIKANDFISTPAYANEQYQLGYNRGVNAGKQEVYDDQKYTDGIYQQGYTAGYNKGLDDKNVNLNDYFIGIAETPFMVLKGLLNFNIFGFNMFNFFTSIITLFLGIWLIKKF